MSASSGCGIRTASVGISVGSTCIPEKDPHCMSRSVFRVEGGEGIKITFFCSLFLKLFLLLFYLLIFLLFCPFFLSCIFRVVFFWLR